MGWFLQNLSISQTVKQTDLTAFFHYRYIFFLQNCINALGKSWHPDHFVCAFCGRGFGNEGFLVDNGKPYCGKCFEDLFSVKCGKCLKPITGGEKYVEALNKNWHSQCFTCTVSVYLISVIAVTQQLFNCQKAAIETLEKIVNMIKGNNKNSRTTSLTVVLVSLFVSFEHITYLVLVFLRLTFNR